MSAIADSPTRSTNNSFINRYIQNLENEGSPQLKPLSPSKLNSSSNLNLLKSNQSSPIKPTKLDSQVPKFTTKIDSHSKSVPPLYSSNVNPSAQFDKSTLSKDELKYYELLCRVGEVKCWIEEVIGQEIEPEIELCAGDALRNGVYLATVAQKINPSLVPTVYPAGKKLEFKHTQNINAFFTLVDHVGVPNSFRFELQDLYNKKDLPQVFETLNIMITIINKKWPTKTPGLTNLSGQLTFTKDDLKKCQRTWPRIRDFKSLAVSPTSSPIKKTKVQSGLIEDFNEFQNNKEPVLDETIYKTPEKKKPVDIKRELTPSISDLQLPSHNTKAENFNESTPKVSYKSPFKSIDYDILTRTPNLEYSPLKLSSLSYHSPSIARYSTLDTDFYLRRSQNREQGLQFYNTHSYSPTRYSPTRYSPTRYSKLNYSPNRRQKMTEDEFLDNVIDIQSICRSANLRFDLNIKMRLAKLHEKEVIFFQSLVRGNEARSKFNKPFKMNSSEISLSELSHLQATIKGIILRENIDRKRIRILRQEKDIIGLQSMCRACLARANAQAELMDINNVTKPLIKLQAVIKGILFRQFYKTSTLSSLIDKSAITLVQSVYRGNLKRAEIAKLNHHFNLDCTNSVSRLQAVSKGYLTRNKILNTHKQCLENDETILKLSTYLRGSRARKDYQMYQINEDSDVIIALQSSIRGVLVRYTLDLVDDVVENSHISVLQARIRAIMIRSRLDKRKAHFLGNTKSIIKIQSWVRCFNQRIAYKELMSTPNPSLWSVRKFVHLLNNIGNIENIQNELEKSQAELDSENMRREKMESELRQQLDFSDILDKYKIENNLEQQMSNVHAASSKYPGYEKLFYLLQVDPTYWKLLYRKDPLFTEDNVYVTFSIVNQRMGEREKVCFTRFVAELLHQNMVDSHSITNFMNNNTHFWQKLIKLFIQREYPDLISLFLPILEYINDRNIDFTSDPSVIYRLIHGIECTDRSSAIEDDQTKIHFIENLKNVWHAVEMIAEIFTSRIEAIPVEIRYLCSKIFTFAADQNYDQTSSLRCISKIVVGTLVKEYLVNRRYYGFVDNNYSNIEEKIAILMHSLEAVFEMRDFEGYYDPLNQYSAEIKPYLKDMLMQIMVGPEYEQESERLIYEDMLSVRPRLEILSEKVIQITNKFQEYLKYIEPDDMIVDILKQCSDDKSIPRTGRVTLELNPASYRFLQNDDKMKRIYDQVKRIFMYMMQVEDVDTNLYDLAVSTVLDEDEPSFSTLLNDNPRIKEDPILKKLESPLYFSLKMLALRNIHELENIGMLNPADNQMQSILNDIANNIKFPIFITQSVEEELDITRYTVHELAAINKQLNSDVTLLKRSINNIIEKFRVSKDYTVVHKGALGNLKDAYKKVHSKGGDNIQGLKFKWSTKQLYEKGVVKNIEGEKLGELTVKVFGSSGPKFPDIYFKIFTSDGGKFGIQISDKRKGPSKRYSHLVDTFDFFDLLNTQVGKKVSTWYLFNGKITFSTSKLLELLSANFFNKHN
ncbi:hypothetical protein Kpol_1060p30 [Vanderwaltozyma polyspora DSM 70294]|uniref:Calponin-homology (CH) domain-containing protein n=1 Tax=Vanderwaltozyma polyspora (strain ATCC 22028 / DSM 70294 / BCRC 21397 / CBS 2163 / NBRC 10782 / NRRL Y-8283 / UCD 57-17) TaxID=436907 RepID=A7TK28_VANPO|nr:uncharacterized protein Kpol_1060p30 [Vanderwaltozyma polyspora DSM 70294]EDO17374.1 hypothetical protein Kpol_1060p30 [Vanderwaltozyma polyspora DSM 70294]